MKCYAFMFPLLGVWWDLFCIIQIAILYADRGFGRPVVTQLVGINTLPLFEFQDLYLLDLKASFSTLPKHSFAHSTYTQHSYLIYPTKHPVDKYDNN